MTAAYAPMALLLGFLAMVGQLIVFRSGLAVFHGNELMIALMFVFWFAGIALGSLVRGSMRGRADGSWSVLPVILAAMPVVGAAQLAGLYAVRNWLDVPPGLLLDIRQAVPACALCVMPLAVLVGLAFPIAAAWAAAADPAGRSGRAAGRVYWLEGVGSLAGGMAYTFGWAGRWPALPVLGAVETLALAVVAAGLTVAAKRDLRSDATGGRQSRAMRTAATAVGALVVVAAAAVGFGVTGRLQGIIDAVYWRSLAPGVRLVALRESRYQLLGLGEREGQYTLYLNGLQSGSFPEPFEVDTRVHFYMNQCRQPESVLVVGRGLEGEIQRMLDYPLRHLTLVCLDPAYAALVEPSLPPGDRAPLADPRLHRIAADAVDYLARSRERFDLILLHVPPPSTAANNRFYTREFFTRCRERLAPGGVLVTGLEGGENVIAGVLERSVGTLYRTLAGVFPQVLAAPGARLTFFASDGQGTPTVDPDELARRFEGRRLDKVGWFTPRHFRLLLPEDRVAWLRGVLERSDPAWENTEGKPVSYLLALRLWDQATGGRLRFWLEAVEGLNLTVLVMLAAVGLIGITAAGRFQAMRRGAGRADATGAAGGVFMFGFLGMGLEILLLYRVQNLFGYVYSMMGVLIGLFMLGLAAGAWWMDRRESWPPARTVRWAFCILPSLGFALCVLASLATGLPPGLALPAICLQIFAAGAMTGLYFPLAGRLQTADSAGAVSAAGRINACDHLGALAGAGLTGLLFLPALGDARTLVFFALLLLLLPAWGLFARPRG